MTNRTFLKAARRIAGAASNLHVELVDGNAAPTIQGEQAGYVRATPGEPYSGGNVRSDLRVVVGRAWTPPSVLPSAYPWAEAFLVGDAVQVAIRGFWGPTDTRWVHARVVSKTPAGLPRVQSLKLGPKPVTITRERDIRK